MKRLLITSLAPCCISTEKIETKPTARVTRLETSSTSNRIEVGEPIRR
jgi:hypothetical protein